MTNRNATPIPSIESILTNELRESARLIALAAATELDALSDSSLDASYAYARMLATLTAAAYCDDFTTDASTAFDRLLDDDFADDLTFAEHLALPIARYFDID